MKISEMIKKATELTTVDILNQYKPEIDELIQKIKEIHTKYGSNSKKSTSFLIEKFGKFGKFVVSYCERGFVKDEIVANDISTTVYFEQYDIKRTLKEIIYDLNFLIFRNII